MNERIKDLLKQAGVNDNWNKADWYSMSPAMVEKFAELIVRECARKVNEDTTPDSGYTYEPWKLLEHFGIEE